ncbi:MAG: hypothetical protein CMQ19_14610 [Gammaproteobacteria bacterium]|nr:hypothetical protein [Gammaproteobacteria bacterium]
MKLCSGGKDTSRSSTWALLPATATIKTQHASSTIVVHWNNRGRFDRPLKGISVGSSQVWLQIHMVVLHI